MAITKAMRFGNIVFHIDISVSQVHKVEEIPINKIKIADVHNFEKVFRIWKKSTIIIIFISYFLEPYKIRKFRRITIFPYKLTSPNAA